MFVDGSVSMLKFKKATQDAPLLLEPLQAIRFDHDFSDKKIREATIDDSASRVYVLLNDKSEMVGTIV